MGPETSSASLSAVDEKGESQIGYTPFQEGGLPLKPGGRTAPLTQDREMAFGPDLGFQMTETVRPVKKHVKKTVVTCPGCCVICGNDIGHNGPGQ